MELKQLRSFAAVVRYGSFTRAAENTCLSQPTISTHIRALEEELNTQLLLRDTKNLQVTPRGQELYECACRMLELQDNLLQRWRQSDQHIIQLGASTIPSACILPEMLPRYGKQNPGSYFVVHQSDSRQVIQGVAEGLFDVGMSGMPCQDEAIRCEPFFRDRMVLITPVSRRFLALQSQGGGRPARAAGRTHHSAGGGQRQPEKRRPLSGPDGPAGKRAAGHRPGERSGIHQESGIRRAGGIHRVGKGGAGFRGGKTAAGLSAAAGQRRAEPVSSAAPPRQCGQPAFFRLCSGVLPRPAVSGITQEMTQKPPTVCFGCTQRAVCFSVWPAQSLNRRFLLCM